MIDMFIRMTLPADRLEVIKRQCDLRPVDIQRSKLFDVMDDDRWSLYPFSETILAFISYTFEIGLPTIFPCLGLVEVFCEFF